MKVCKYCDNLGYIDKLGREYAICKECLHDKLSKQRIGRIVTDETRKKISEANKGHKSWNKGLTKETDSRISGYKHSEEFKEKMSKRMSGKNNPMYGIPSPNTGKKFTEEHKKKMSENHKGMKGKKHSEESKKRMSKNHSGDKHWNYNKKHSEETKDKIRESTIRYKINNNIIFTTIGKNETKILDQIEKESGYKILRQYQVIGYFVDGYDPINNIVYEVNEKHHFTEKQMIKDEQRQLNITQYLGCEWVNIDDV